MSRQEVLIDRLRRSSGVIQRQTSLVELTEPIHLKSGERIIANSLVLMTPGDATWPAIEVEGNDVYIEGVSFSKTNITPPPPGKGSIGINVRDGSDRCTIVNCDFAGMTWPAVWLGHNDGAVLDRCFFAACGDNGLQLECPTNYFVRNCGFVGPFGNSAINGKHGGQTGGMIEFCTVIDVRGYGVILEAWKPGCTSVMANCLVLVRKPGAGATGYSIVSGGGGTFESNAVLVDGAPYNVPVALEYPGVEELACHSWLPQSFEDMAPRDAHVPWIGQTNIAYKMRYDALLRRRDVTKDTPGAVVLA